MYVIDQVQHQITSALTDAVCRARDKGELPFEHLPAFVLEVPREKGHGDFASNLAMTMAREIQQAPRLIAVIIIRHLDLTGTWIQRVEVAGPGFINFFLDYRWLHQLLPQVELLDDKYGWSETGRGQKVQVEFVSANPTGLLHMGNARGAALGDSIAALLEATGHQVSREFYINDAGNQIINFGKSLEARYLQLLGQDVPFPDEGYHGEDVVDTMRRLVQEVGDRYLGLPPELRRENLIEYALAEKLEAMRQSLAKFGVVYDVWFSERILHESGAIQNVIAELRQNGFVYEKEGALWFRSACFGDEKDEVVVRGNGVPTYFAADIAYHQEKFKRGFDRVINIWGADHHGHVARMGGAMAALGYDPSRLKIVLMQLVRLIQGGEVLRMSKRTGQYITLDELVGEVGVDAARFFFVMRSTDSHLEFDLDLAKSQSAENPVYYIQYAHARICSIMRQAAEQGYHLPGAAEAAYGLLADPAELELLRKIADFPAVVAGAAESLEPHRLTRYAQELAALFHVFYTNCRVLTPEDSLRGTRLALADAARITLRNLLRLIGVSSPERM